MCFGRDLEVTPSREEQISFPRSSPGTRKGFSQIAKIPCKGVTKASGIRSENGTPWILIAVMTPTCPPIWELFTPGTKASKPHQKFTCEISSLTNVTFSYNPKKYKIEIDRLLS